MKTSVSFLAVSMLTALSPATSTMNGPYTDDFIDSLFARSICKSDDSVEAKCYMNKTQVYQNSKAALRIRNNGRAHCTGWLVGEEGHILTNWHCIENAREAKQMIFEGMAEGLNCSTSCASSLGCPGTMLNDEDTPMTFITTGGSLQNDWTLLQLPLALRSSALAEYGYLTLRRSGALEGEEIYVPQHPRGWGKKIAMKDGTKPATVIDANYNDKNGCGLKQVAYKADTQGGSSGSPVLAMSDHTVIAIHHCGGCAKHGNTAVNVQSIISGTRGLLPMSAFSTPPSYFDIALDWLYTPYRYVNAFFNL